ncbi:MAG: helix-turn-helix domain-containing protein [Paracoccus sp. (in: a-proteobacteria)]|uniref:helix-turn-helix domain-containing protein n=1 Tax=Paracoccus sp. TaxID=267 RepID=UPI0026E00578|nr:helix-turn-helix domain-containing protein [Paracoccus sp. (in: a-proteobacteria)]MDO5620275.1 helix-turn-helix domain-containing protein [Paracoccus sp. (in: a-proteobacteria)]
MSASQQIPVFNLFGETSAFPDVVHVERIHDRAHLHDWQIFPHRHRDMAQLFLIEQGQAAALIDGQDITLEQQQILYIPPMVVHGFRFRQHSEGLVISLPAPVLAGLSVQPAEITRSFVTVLDPGLEALTGQLAAAFPMSGTYRTQLLVLLAQALLIALAAKAGAAQDQAPQPRQMQRFQQLLADPQTLGWRPGDFARALSITPGHLNRLCHDAHGMTASRQIEARLMTEACRLLAFTRLPVAEIGWRLGFEDPAHFSRRFRLHQGQSPSAYRAPFTS